MACALAEAPRRPLYAVATFVPRRGRLSVGALGTLALARGWYVYVGSARRSRTARVERHLRPAKRVRWHADYLFVAYPPAIAWLVDVPEVGGVEAGAVCRAASRSPAAPQQSAECRFAAALAAAGGLRPSPAAPARHGHPAKGQGGARGHRSVAPLRFGASDCGCPGHLVWFPDRRSLQRSLQAAAEGLGASLRHYGRGRVVIPQGV